MNITEAEDFRVRQDAIRKFYASCRDEILSKKAHEWGVYPAEVQGLTQWSPIEVALWSDIREEGIVLYPQYPVDRFYVDFGNPVAKVAIECDGKEFHIDWRADRERQREIEARGWKVYRITGSMCMRNGDYCRGEDAYGPSPAVEFLREIAIKHRLSGRFARRPS